MNKGIHDILRPVVHPGMQMTTTYQRERQVAIQAVREAAALCGAVQAEITAEVLEKADRSPVTVADFGSQALICRTLGEVFGGDAVIAEEDADALRRAENSRVLDRVTGHVRRFDPDANAATVCDWIDRGGGSECADRFWTLDPIDGTKGFLRGEQYAVALALVVGGEVRLAALACPMLPVNPDAPEPRGALFVVVRGQGASAVPLAGDGSETPLRVSDLTDPARARCCESVESVHSSQAGAAAVAARLGITAPPMRLDSQAKYGVVARGEAEIYMRLPTGGDYQEKIWDHAAGALIVSEAGGTVTDIAGRPLEFTHGRTLAANHGILVTNGRLHQAVLAALE